MMLAIERQVSGFEMPGSGIPDFARHAAAIAREGIYDLAVHHDHVLVPTVERNWRIDDLDDLDADAEQARDRLHARMQRGARVAKRLTERRADQLSLDPKLSEAGCRGSQVPRRPGGGSRR
jgi:acyl-[acyl-carrier-protein] desaturase